MTETDTPIRRDAPLRSDARHNRERILTVAREALELSADASLNSIAKQAGVGPGTLYRHFPSREALVLAVYRSDVEALADSTSALLAEHPPMRALRLWLERLAQCGSIRHGLAEALHAASADDLSGDMYGQVVAAVARLLAACERDGSIRPGVNPEDVILLLGFLWQIGRTPDDAARAARLLDVIVDGLEAGAPRTGRARRRTALRSLRLPRRLSLASVSGPRSH